jgi:hypothetical protein
MAAGNSINTATEPARKPADNMTPGFGVAATAVSWELFLLLNPSIKLELWRLRGVQKR